MKHRGVVRFYDEEKGFGFVSSQAFRDDLYFNASALDGDPPDAGAPVKFNDADVRNGEPNKKLLDLTIRERNFKNRRSHSRGVN